MNTLTLKGKIWKFGDHVSVYYFFPAKYELLGIAEQPAELAKHFLEEVDPHLVRQVTRGDVLSPERASGKASITSITSMHSAAWGCAGFVAEIFTRSSSASASTEGFPRSRTRTFHRRWSRGIFWNWILGQERGTS
ncbi:hypothetical protein LRP30_32385 [Bradyrhizobium sp. C-145]|uniref:hypothetical protein n=1 Tax=Bradyrhizobium sp. C-145 TaxID=574727 RepID=UPI00201B5DFC|nr:hypothetical protein [Bradyrhizobium sp. C-145]UQR61514.1 hypothetical protein LRP30_32385 [Bradyrhizobium sp. C-145]